MFSVEWSEHCGYLHSRRWLVATPRGEFSPLRGEDAGGIVYDDLAVVLNGKSQSPFSGRAQAGAATGIGGVIRDILGSGARPIACLDSLHFGPREDERSLYVFRGVVEGAFTVIVWEYHSCWRAVFYPAFREIA